MLSLNEKLSEVQRLRLRATILALPLFFGERKFYARAHLKLTRQWKSTLRDEFFKIPYFRNYWGNGYKLSVQRYLGWFGWMVSKATINQLQSNPAISKSQGK